MSAYTQIQELHNELNSRLAALLRQRKDLADTLLDALEVLQDYSDVDDGPYGPVPNKAMRACTDIAAALEKAAAAEPVVVTCGCGRSYTVSTFDALPPPPKGDRQSYPADDEGPAYTLLYRNCPCGSTITREVANG